jgi:MarR family transcriptional regulator, temperature-dependent positive regulator of motility
VLDAENFNAAVPGRPAELDGLSIDAVTIARLWENPCWFSFRFNYLALRYNIPLYGWIERTYRIPRPQFVVLYSLGLRDRVTARDISISYGFPKTSLSRAVAALERRGLICREPNPADGRSFLLALTPKGRAIFDETLPAFVRLQEEMLKPLSRKERETLSVLLARIVLRTFEWPGVDETAALPFPEPAKAKPRS